IRDRFACLLPDAAERVLGAGSVVEIIPSGTQRAAHGAGDHVVVAAGRPSTSGDPLAAGPVCNPKLTFDQFVIGDSNRLAHAAALTVAELPAQAYNPLFICGPPGVGKTHLLSAIASLLLSHSPGLTVRCTTGEAFTNEFLGALGGKHTEDFKARF